MILSPKLVLRQSQSLAMTPQLLQAIKLLQLSALDLEAYVAAEAERNPLLEREDAEEARGDPPEAAEPAAETPDAEPGDLFPEDPSWPAAFEGPSTGSWTGVGTGGGAEGGWDIEDAPAPERSLAEHLSSQLSLALADPKRRMIGAALIGLLDEAGYLRESAGEIAARLGVARREVEEVLAVVRTFDPTGVFARDLADCLGLQLAERNRLDPAMRAMLGRLDLVAKRDMAALRRVCGVDGEDIADMVAELKALTPKPGAAFGGEHAQTVTPDVIVKAGPDGGWTIELNSDAMPRVLVNRAYYAVLAVRARGSHEKSYLSERLQSANWLAKSLDQRARTILKVSTEIVRRQEAFFLRGVRALRPLNLKSVADAIGMHESTVSRVTANKVMATPRGIFEMKYFFTTAIAATKGGEAHSSEAVRRRIRDMIESESPIDALSDDAIVRKLQADGVDIARRTVAKYREAMRIPSSVQRRREKRPVSCVRAVIDTAERAS